MWWSIKKNWCNLTLNDSKSVIPSYVPLQLKQLLFETFLLKMLRWRNISMQLLKYDILYISDSALIITHKPSSFVFFFSFSIIHQTFLSIIASSLLALLLNLILHPYFPGFIDNIWWTCSNPNPLNRGSPIRQTLIFSFEFTSATTELNLASSFPSSSWIIFNKLDLTPNSIQEIN